MAIEVPNFS